MQIHQNAITGYRFVDVDDLQAVGTDVVDKMDRVHGCLQDDV
ncbi:hypothetical protein R3Q08_31260 [Rhodococcus erythropolis]|nr:hypothetical protein [Rhodococcus erythropolis]MDV6212739.1 hypothetical protein [Rhodococcus erythropolis]